MILKKPIKKATLGAKKNGLGAQKVRINFDEIEQRAAEKERQKEAEIAANKLAYQAEIDGKQKAEDAAAMQKLSAKFAMQDLDAQRKQMEAKCAKDPSKAASVDRLGMGGVGRAKAAHSVAGGIRSIKQDDVFSFKKSPSPKEDDDWEVIDDKYGKKSTSNEDDFFTKDYTPSKKPVKEDDFFDSYETQPAQKSRYSASSSSTASKVPTTRLTAGSTPASDVDIQKKFGNAKAISSDMYFGNNEIDASLLFIFK